MAVKERIDNTTAGLMIAAAFFLFDLVGGLVNLIPYAGQVLSDLVSLTGFLVMGFWFILKGVKFLDGENIGKKAGTLAFSIIIEAVPILNVLPALTFFVVRTIIMVKSEDKVNALKESTGAVGKLAERGHSKSKGKSEKPDETPADEDGEESEESGPDSGQSDTDGTSATQEYNSAPIAHKAFGGVDTGSIKDRSLRGPDSIDDTPEEKLAELQSGPGGPDIVEAGNERRREKFKEMIKTGDDLHQNSSGVFPDRR